jgi:hypothetical protein
MSTDRSPDDVVWDLMRGALTARALAVVVELGVPEALESGPRLVDDLASDSGADPETLYRLMRALASDGVFAEGEPRVFEHTAVSETLRDGAGWGELALLFGGVWHRPAGELAADGRPTFERINGTDFWSWLAAHPAERALFDRAMGEGKERRADRLETVEWRGDETVVDVGGGNGSLLVELLARRPGLRGIVFDLPETVRDETAFGDRCSFTVGNFFENVPSGDAFVLSTILHDWDDEAAAMILRVVRAAAPPGARLVLLERVIQPGNDAQGSKWLDLLMLALFAGRERDEAQWRARLDANGWAPVTIADGVIEARCR